MSILRLYPVLFDKGRCRSLSTVQESYWSRYRRQLKGHPLPIWSVRTLSCHFKAIFTAKFSRAGLVVIGYLQFRRIRQRNNSQSQDEIEEISPMTLTLYKVLPLASLSRVAGALSQASHFPLPEKETDLDFFDHSYIEIQLTLAIIGLDVRSEAFLYFSESWQI
jgi:hypothetical protein